MLSKASVTQGHGGEHALTLTFAPTHHSCNVDTFALERELSDQYQSHDCPPPNQ